MEKEKKLDFDQIKEIANQIQNILFDDKDEFKIKESSITQEVKKMNPPESEGEKKSIFDDLENETKFVLKKSPKRTIKKTSGLNSKKPTKIEEDTLKFTEINFSKINNETNWFDNEKRQQIDKLFNEMENEKNEEVSKKYKIASLFDKSFVHPLKTIENVEKDKIKEVNDIDLDVYKIQLNSNQEKLILKYEREFKSNYIKIHHECINYFSLSKPKLEMFDESKNEFIEVGTFINKYITYYPSKIETIFRAKLDEEVSRELVINTQKMGMNIYILKRVEKSTFEEFIVKSCDDQLIKYRTGQIEFEKYYDEFKENITTSFYEPINSVEYIEERDLFLINKKKITRNFQTFADNRLNNFDLYFPILDLYVESKAKSIEIYKYGHQSDFKEIVHEIHRKHLMGRKIIHTTNESSGLIEGNKIFKLGEKHFYFQEKENHILFNISTLEEEFEVDRKLKIKKLKNSEYFYFTRNKTDLKLITFQKKTVKINVETKNLIFLKELKNGDVMFLYYEKMNFNTVHRSNHYKFIIKILKLDLSNEKNDQPYLYSLNNTFLPTFDTILDDGKMVTINKDMNFKLLDPIHNNDDFIIPLPNQNFLFEEKGLFNFFILKITFYIFMKI
jgi:hypothetical protein